MTHQSRQDAATIRKQQNAWAFYDVANSAFFTTILAAVLPAYYSSVAGSTLPDAATATARWSLSLSIALAISAVLAPILGTLSDVIRGKKLLLALFTGVGAMATGTLVLVSTGDWLLASVMIVVARVGAAGANVFYDALLPHVAKTPEDQDALSSRGFALGYLGGGVLLAINVAMIQLIPDEGLFPFAGVRLSFITVAVWWVLFTIPLLRTIPEPQTLVPDTSRVVATSFSRIWHTLRDLRRYGELFKLLIAFLIYNDGIGTIIGVAVIYGAELGFGDLELILALLLVQFVGIPFSLMFGSLPNPQNQQRSRTLAYIVFNAVALPLVAIIARGQLTAEQSTDLRIIIGMLLAVQIIGGGFALLGGGHLLRGVASQLNTKRTILLALLVYSVIAVWGYFLNTTVEFWFLAWMVAIVQGGSQALSRSLYASMCPPEKSGEFFGLYGIMSKFSAITGPLLFAAAATIFGSSRPAILSLIVLFVVGGAMLMRVDVSSGQLVAHQQP